MYVFVHHLQIREMLHHFGERFPLHHLDITILPPEQIFTVREFTKNTPLPGKFVGRVRPQLQSQRRKTLLIEKNAS